MVSKKKIIKKKSIKKDDNISHLKLVSVVSGAATLGGLAGATGYSLYKKKLENDKRNRDYLENISRQSNQTDIKLADAQGYMRGYTSGVQKARDDADAKYTELILRVLKMNK